MAFPSPDAFNTSITDTAGTSHTLNLPTGIASGDLLMVFFDYAVISNTITFPGGWTTLTTASIENAVGSTEGLATAYRIASGSEGSSITVTTSVSTRANHQSIRITAHDSSTAPEAVAGTVNNATPDPPALTPTGGAQDYLWIAVGARSRASTTADLSAAPTNYSNLTTSANSGTGSAFSTGGIAKRQLNASSEDPGTFTSTDTTAESCDATIAVYPMRGLPRLTLLGVGI